MLLEGSGCKWVQKVISLEPHKKGCYLITDEIKSKLPELEQFKFGTAHIHIMHTSASLAVSENWDPTVLQDMDMFFNHAVPRNLPYKHRYEGADDMPAHIRSVLTGSSVTVPVFDGEFRLGQWQGIVLMEHRDNEHQRDIVVTIQGAEITE